MDEPAEGSLQSALAWVAGLLTGSLATATCVLAVAALGAVMLTGHVPAKRAGGVIVGCFILLSAATIAHALTGSGGSRYAASDPIEQAPAPAAPPPPSILPAPAQPYDPYAFASVPH